MASGFQIDGVDLDDIYAPYDPRLPAAELPGFFPTPRYAARDWYLDGWSVETRGYMLCGGILSRFTQESSDPTIFANSDFYDSLVKKGYRPANEYRWKIGGGYGGGASDFYLWTNGSTVYASNTAGTTLFSAASDTRIVFFRISGGGGRGGGSTWTDDGVGGGGAGCGVGWMEIPITATFSSGIRVYLGGWGGTSTIYSPHGNATYNAGGTPGAGGFSAPAAESLPGTWRFASINGGGGASPGGTAGGTYVVATVYTNSTLLINNPGVNNGGGSGGAGGASLGPSTGYNPEPWDGGGGCGAYSGAGNSGTWEYGGAGAFYLYF